MSKKVKKFKIGDRVRVRSTTIRHRKISRGRLRQPLQKRRQLSRRIGTSREAVGGITSRGSRRLFYVSRRNLDNINQIESCLYRSLIGVELTVVELGKPWVICQRESGTTAPGLTVEDIEYV